jgi:hypothetical protein
MNQKFEEIGWHVPQSEGFFVISGCYDCPTAKGSPSINSYVVFMADGSILMYCSTFVFVVDVVSSFNHKAVKWLMTVAG